MSVTLALLMHVIILTLLIWQGSIIPKPKFETPQSISAGIGAIDPKIKRDQQAEEQRQKRRQQQEEAKKRKAVEQKRLAEALKKEQAEREAAEQKRLAEAREKEQAEREAAAKEKQLAEQQKQLQLKRKKEEEQRKKTVAEKQRAEEEAIRRRIEEKRDQEAAKQRAEEQRLWEDSERIRAERAAEQAAIDAEAIASMESVMFDMISSQWIRPPGVGRELETTLQVALLGTGELANNGIKIIKPSGNTAFDRSAVQAVEKAAPFPLLRLEPRQRDEFRQLIFVFTPEDLAP